MAEECNPTFAKVDAILDLLTKSKSLHILLVLDQTGYPFEILSNKIRSQLLLNNRITSAKRTRGRLFNHQENS